jgi:putative solute:sodium symporter small subunit
MPATARRAAYWRKALRITAVLLAVWFAVTFGASYYARELNAYSFLGFPLGFYMGAQGCLLVYLVIIWFYARYMNRLDNALEEARADGAP